jgi:hypothetical protein
LSKQQPCPIFTLVSGVVHSPVEALLVATIGGLATLDPRAAAAMLAAVPMTAVAGLADSEGNPAPAAQQQVQNNVRHHTLHRHHSSNGGQALATVRCLEHCCCVRPGRSVRTTGAFPCLETISQFPTNRGFAADDYIFIQDRKSRSGLSGQLYVRIPRFSAAVFTNAKQRTFRTPWSADRGLGTRRFDGFDRATGTYFEANTQPWSQMSQDKLSQKLSQAASDLTLMQTNRSVKQVVWFGTEDLPRTGLGAQLREALSKAGIPYWVVKP